LFSDRLPITVHLFGPRHNVAGVTTQTDRSCVVDLCGLAPKKVAVYNDASWSLVR
jgi:hypothetical protein